MSWDRNATSGKDASLYVFARKIDQYGSNSLIRADKIQLTQQLGVQLRDLRVLDPSLACAHPSALFCRDKALIVNLEDINCIITTQFVLMKDVQEIAQSLFAEKLQGQCVRKNGKTYGVELNSNRTDASCHRPFELKVLDLVLDLVRSRLDASDLIFSAAQCKLQCNTTVQVCSRIEHLTSEMEGDALSALDAFVKKVMATMLMSCLEYWATW